MRDVVLITGASSGLGLAVAVQAAQAGCRVYATMRDVDKSDALLAAASGAAAGTVTVLPMDVQDMASVEAAVAKVIAAEARIDVLVANAGIGFARTTEQASEADAAMVLDVNFMGLLRSVKAVLPHMRRVRSGRVIAISSVGGLVGQPFNEIYCASKFAVEGYIESLASYAGPAFGIHFTAVEPGGISSEFAATAMKQFMASGGMIEDDYLPLIRKYLGARQGRAGGVFQTADEVALVVLAVMADKTPPVRIRTSAWAEAFCGLKTAADPEGRKLQAKVIAEVLGGMD